MTQRVGIEFDGSSRGAVTAAREVTQSVDTVTRSARSTSAPLRGFEQDLGRVERGALAGSGALHGMGRAALYLGSTYVGAFSVGAALKAASAELVTQIRLGAQTAAVLRSTGGIAGVTAAEISKLAEAESRKTGVDRDQIKAAELMLLRYTNVRDVAGQGNDVFTRATKTALDLSVALGVDAATSATQLGKALNDPVRGLSLLRREGASFTAAEAAQIKTLAQHGHILEAQKAILDALAKSYGGTADAVGRAEPWNRMLNTARELAASGLRPLLPEFDQLTTRAQKWADHLANDSQAQLRLKDDVQQGINVAKTFVKGADDVAGALGGWKATLEGLIALKFGPKLFEWVGAMNALIGSEAAASAAGLAGAEFRSEGLLRSLTRLKNLGPITLTIALAFVPKAGSNPNAGAVSNSGAAKFFAGLPVVGGLFSQLNRAGDWTNAELAKIPGIGKYFAVGGQSAGDITRQARGAGIDTNTGFRSGTQQNIVAEARRLGVGSGAVYSTGGGHGGISKPGQVLDCSGFVYQVYTQNGFKNFPGVSETQWSTKSGPNWTSVKVSPSQALPGDVVFMVGSPEYPSPGHVGIVTSGAGESAMVMQYYQTGKVADTIPLRSIGDLVGIKRFFLAKRDGKAAAAKPPTSPPVPAASTNPLPAAVRQAISSADVAVASAALTPGKRDDRAAIAQQRKALNDEIAWLDAKLKTKLGAEKRITYEDLLTGALGDLKTLQTVKPGAKGASIGVIEGLRTSITEGLRHLPQDLDAVEQAAVSHLDKIRAALKVGMSAKDIADARAGVKHWGDVLKDEISKQSKIAAAAAASAANSWQRTWQTDVDRVLRDFQQNVVNKKLDEFDRATQAGLKKIQDKYSAQTPEEKALAAFDAAQAAADEAKQRADIASQITDTQAKLDALGQPGAGGGTLIDIATGARTTLTGNAAAGEDIVQQRKDLLAQLADLQYQAQQLDLQDQRAALETAAEQSRTAADQKATDEENGYQTERDTQRIGLQNMLDDQATALSNDLDDWNTWIGEKQKSWQAFITWLGEHGIASAGLTNPNVGEGGSLADARAAGFTQSLGFLGRAGIVGFAGGGDVPGVYMGRDSVPSMLSPGERVLTRTQNAQLERLLSGGAPTVVTIVEVNGREFARQVSEPMTAEQARQIGYTIQRS